ncbi:uncharacterized protein ISCGN_013602 [Ixodes scapularis]
MSHVWLLNLKTDAAKLKLVEAGRLAVNGRISLVIDPARQDLRIKLHWVSFDVSNDMIRKAFSEYGEVKDVPYDRLKVPGFEGAESTTRIVRLVLRECVTLDRLPHQCPEFRAFGHEREDCVRSYARAAGGGVNDEYADDGMNDEEAVKAAAPSAAPTPGVTEGAPGTVPAEDIASPRKPPATAAPATPPAVERQSEASQESDVVGAALVPAEVSPEPEMNAEEGSAKRRFEDVTDMTGEQLRLRQLERKWKVVAGWKGVDGKQSTQGVISEDDLLEIPTDEIVEGLSGDLRGQRCQQEHRRRRTTCVSSPSPLQLYLEWYKPLPSLTKGKILVRQGPPKRRGVDPLRPLKPSCLGVGESPLAPPKAPGNSGHRHATHMRLASLHPTREARGRLRTAVTGQLDRRCKDALW